jgi:glycosyltransferase involved in cell wall biosynthesis
VPGTLPLDPRLEVVGTAPFDGIAGYVRHAPSLLRANAAPLRRAIASADLVWIKVPASNALLAAWLAWRAGVPRFGYVAGSALAVARGRGLGLGAQAVGLAYDVAGRIAGGRHRIVVGRGLTDGSGIVTSLVEPEEIRDRSGEPWPAIPWRLRIAWAGRVAHGKGLEALIDALAILATKEANGQRTELVLIGDGPARNDLEARADELGVADRIHWLGYVADRFAYMNALASCDVLVSPSPAEGFPKAVLDAMAVGLPIVTVLSGQLAGLGDQHAELVAEPEAAGVAETVTRLRERPDRARRLSAAGSALATAHTRQAETERLTVLLRAWSTRVSRR